MKSIKYIRSLLIALTFTAAPLSFADLPAPAKQLKHQYQTSIDAAEMPIQEKYIKDLDLLFQQYKQKGQLEDAIKVKNEIDQIIVKSMFGKWRDPAASAFLYIFPNGICSHSTGTTGTWEIKESNLVLSWKNKWKYIYPVTKTNNLLRGKTVSPKGESKPFLGPRLPDDTE